MAWKAYARGAPLLVKEYTASGSAERLFEFAALAGLDTEQRLSQLARWIVKPRRRWRALWPASAASSCSIWTRDRLHRQRCLRALALFAARAMLECLTSASERATHWMIGAYLIGALLHLGQVPSWVIVVACSGALWALAAAHGRARLPGRVFKIVARAGAHRHGAGDVSYPQRIQCRLGAAGADGRHQIARGDSRRDRLIVVGVAFYLLLAACLVSQELLRAPLYLLEAWVCCTALL